MKRKVVKHGPSTLIVSIPSGWARKFNVNQGDELDVDEQGSRLVIDAKKEQKLPELNLNISSIKPKMIRRFLINAYQSGYDQLNISYSNPEQCHYVEHKLPELMGYEIIERTNEGCIIKNIAGKIDIDFKNSIKKIFLIIESMINELYEAYKIDNKKILSNIHYKDIDINKFTSFCLRVINKETYTGYKPSEIHSLYHMIITLENLADNYKALSDILVKFPKDRDILDILLKNKEYFMHNHKFFYNPNKEKLIESMNMNRQILKAIKEGFKKSKDSRKLLILTLLNTITQITYHITSKHLAAINF